MANRSVDGNICCELGVRSERKQANNFPRRLIAIPSPAGLVPQPVLHAKQLLRHLELMCAVPWGCTGETARANLIVARIARPDQYHQMCGRTLKWSTGRSRLEVNAPPPKLAGLGGPGLSAETYVDILPRRRHSPDVDRQIALYHHM